MSPWTKLERRLRDLPDPALDLRFRFTAYRYEVIQTPWAGELACKFWITQGKSTLWSVPRDRHVGDGGKGIDYFGRRSPGWLVEIAAAYLDLPRDALIDWTPDWPGWGLVDILKACDRRIGRRQWGRLRSVVAEPAALHLLDLRAGRQRPVRPPIAGRNTDELENPA